MQEFSVVDIKETGRNIAFLRKRAGMSVKNLKEVIGGISLQAIYQWERGGRIPSIDNLIILSEIFHVEMDEIIVRKKEKPKNEI